MILKADIIICPIRAKDSILDLLRSTNENHIDPSNGKTVLAESRSEDSTALSNISELLLAGKAQEAASLAVQKELWSHALVLSSALGPDTWSKAVNGFIKATLGPSSNSRSAGVLKIVYGLAAASDTQAACAVIASLSQQDLQSSWKDVLAVVLTNGKSNTSALLLALGDRLRGCGILEAAHSWYVLHTFCTGKCERLIQLTSNHLTVTY